MVARLPTGKHGKRISGIATNAVSCAGSNRIHHVMIVDIWLFGEMMREKFVGQGAFTPAGKIILMMISLLLIGAWLVVLLHGARVRG